MPSAGSMKHRTSWRLTSANLRPTAGSILSEGAAELLQLISAPLRMQSTDCIRNGADMSWSSSAAPSDNIEPAVGRKFAEVSRHDVRCFIEPAEGIRQSGVRITTNRHRSDLRKVVDVRTHLLGAQGAVDPHAQQPHVRNGVPERFHGLSGEGPPTSVRDGD